MESASLPTQTPNAGPIKDPVWRERINNTLGVLAGLLGVVVAVDLSTEAFDWSGYTGPIGVGLAAAISYFNLGVTRLNYPK